MSSGSPAPRLRTVEVDGGPMTVGEWGPEDGTPVLAVHGITASLAGWWLLAAALPEVRLVAPDLRGRGRSNVLPGPYGLDRHAADLEQLLDGLGLDRVVVVGHSMGAFVGVRLVGLGPTGSRRWCSSTAASRCPRCRHRRPGRGPRTSSVRRRSA